MYNIVFIDTEENIISVDAFASLSLHDNGVRITGETLEKSEYGSSVEYNGCNADYYFILDYTDKDVSALSIEEIKQIALDKKQFLNHEPEEIIAIQDEYIKALEAKLKELQG